MVIPRRLRISTMLALRDWLTRIKAAQTLLTGPNRAGNKLANGLLYGILLWVPIPLGSNRPWAWSLLAILSFTLCLWVLLLNRPRDAQYHAITRLPYLIFAGLLLWISIQTLPVPIDWLNSLSPLAGEMYAAVNAQQAPLSLDPSQTRSMLLKSLILMSLFIAVVRLTDSKLRQHRLLGIMFLSGVLQALYGALEVMGGAPQSLLFGYPVSGAATGSFVYKNHFANFILLALCAGVGYQHGLGHTPSSTFSQHWRANARSRITQLFSQHGLVRAGLLVLVIALVLSQSRMGIFALFVALPVGVWMMYRLPQPRVREGREYRRRLTSLLIGVLLIDVLLVSSYFGLADVTQRILATSVHNEQRDDILTSAMPMLSAVYWTGSGAGSFYSQFPHFQDTDVRHFYDHLHNDYLQLLIEYGLVGAGLFTVLVLSTAHQAIGQLRTHRSRRTQGAALAGLMAMLCMSLQMLFDFPLQSPASAVFLTVFLALCWCLSTKGDSLPSAKPS